MYSVKLKKTHVRSKPKKTILCLHNPGYVRGRAVLNCPFGVGQFGKALGGVNRECDGTRQYPDTAKQESQVPLATR
jgi:hypothetical protein